MAKAIVKRIRELEIVSRASQGHDPNKLHPFAVIEPDGSRVIVKKKTTDATGDELDRVIALYHTYGGFDEWLAGAEVDCSPEAMSSYRGKLSDLLAIRDGNTG